VFFKNHIEYHAVMKTTAKSVSCKCLEKISLAQGVATTVIYAPLKVRRPKGKSIN
jgi:hypothetical protein